MAAVAALTPLALAAALVLVPLVREYLAFRRDWGLGPLAALLATLTVIPALALGFAAAAPLAPEPVLQWATTVVVTIVGYSLATAALRPSVTRAARQSG